jgi:hypothetical protein
LSRFIQIATALVVAARASHAGPPLAISPPTPGPLVFTLAQIKGGGARFDVFNQAAAPQAVVAVTTGLFPLNVPSGSGTPTLALSPASATIVPKATQTFQVLPFANVPGPGTYSGLFRLLVGGNDALAPQPITIVVASPDLLRTKDAITLYRCAPFVRSWSPGLWEKTLTIPIRGGVLLSGTAGQAIGAIGRDPGGWAWVRWDGSGKQLSVDSPPNPGTYTGDLILATDPAKVTYTLSVTAKDGVAVPIIVIAIGIALAFYVKRYIGVLRATWELRLQEAELGDDFKRSQLKFAERTRGKPFAAYSIARDVDAQRKKLLKLIKAVERTPGSTVNPTNQVFQAALTELSSLQAGIGLWPDFGDGLDKLSEALAAVRQSINGADMEPPQADPTDPQFLSSGEKLLQGSVITLERLATLGQQVSSLGALAEMWPAARQRAADLTAEFRQVSALPGAAGKAQDVDNARNALVALWAGLGNVSDAAALKALDTSDPGFDKTEIQLKQLEAALGPLPPGGPAPALAAALVPATLAMQNWFQSLTDSRSPASDKGRARLVQARITRADVVVSLFGFTVALITGLNQFYIGKPFGSLADYTSLFIWAAGTKATLDILLAITDQLGIGPSPGNVSDHLKT